MDDYMIRGTAAGEQIRAVATVTTQTVEDARIRHAASATATAALGRSLTAAALLGAGLKDGHSVLLRVLGDGPIGAIVAQADAHGRVRGYAMNPQADLPDTPARKLDVGGLVGKRGTLHVTRDVGLRTPYHGSAPLVLAVTFGIALPLVALNRRRAARQAEAMYPEFKERLVTFAERDAEKREPFLDLLALDTLTVARAAEPKSLIPDKKLAAFLGVGAVSLGVLVAPDLHVLAAGGLCVQVLPGASEGVVADLEARAKRMPPITQLVAEGRTPEEILTAALGGLDPSLGEISPVRFHCRCTRQRVEEMLVSLGAEELEALLSQEGQAEVTCRFCGDRYVLGRDEVEALIADLRRGAAPIM
jgi:molecular chaperone Hsp33